MMVRRVPLSSVWLVVLVGLGALVLGFGRFFWTPNVGLAEREIAPRVVPARIRFLPLRSFATLVIFRSYVFEPVPQYSTTRRPTRSFGSRTGWSSDPSLVSLK